MFLSYTIFTDRDCKTVRHVAELHDNAASDMFRTLRSAIGHEPRERVYYPDLGIRVDRIEL